MYTHNPSLIPSRPKSETKMSQEASPQRSTTSSSVADARKRKRNPLDPTPANFPCGSVSARRHVRQAFKNSSDARTTITNFQRDNGLHANFARALGTVPVHEAAEGEEGSSSVEPLDPSPVLDFLAQLGVSRREVHSRVASALRSAIEDEVQRVPVVLRVTHPTAASTVVEEAGHPALLDLLRSSWQFRDVPELRPVLVCVLRRLGDHIPVPMLRRLGARKADSSELRNADLVGQLGPHLQRLVWEADWDAALESWSSAEGGSDGGGGGVGGGLTLGGSTILADTIRPSVRGYEADASLVRCADLAFVGTLAEKRLATKSRRTVGARDAESGPTTLASIRSTARGAFAASAAATVPTGTGNNNNNADEERSPPPSSAVAVAHIKETIGSRPKLLGAVLDMLIAHHATREGDLDRRAAGAASIVGGATNLACSLVADVLLSYGQLPRSYEVIDIMARTLDASVQSGSISDDAVSQVQGCLRSIFRPAPSSEQEGTKIKLSLKPAAVKAAPSSIFPDLPVDDSEYERKLVQKLVKKALVFMKENDPQVRLV